MSPRSPPRPRWRRLLAPRSVQPRTAFLAAHPPGAGAPLAVVIAAFNEEPTVAEVVAEIPKELAGLASEVIVVVDGARDATAAQARSAGALVCDVEVNRGQGAALRLGYWLARARGAQVIATLDADGQYEPLEIGRVIEPIVSGRADFVSGSRRLGTELTTDGTRHAGVIVFGASDQRPDPPAHHRPGVRRAGDARRGDRGGNARTAPVPGVRADDQRRAPWLPAGRGADHDARSREARDRTKKGGNFGYGLRFARAAIHTWWRDRNAARKRLRPVNTHRS